MANSLRDEDGNRLQNFGQEICATMTETEWTNFTAEKTDTGRLKLLHSNAKIESRVKRLLQLYPTEKDKSVALELKDAGNLAFGTENYQKALELYTRALVWMPHDDTKDASVAYANRSAALFHLNEFQLAQQDAEIAFSLNYPAPLHHKLYERIAKCWGQRGEHNLGKKWIKKAIKALDSSGLDETKLNLFKATYEEFAANCTSKLKASGKIDQQLVNSSRMETLPKVIGGGGIYLKNASKRISLQYQESQGRFIVANETVSPGDVILVEKAYVSALLPEYYHRQCYQCFVELTTPIPCQRCIYASFCSRNCRDEAWSNHHQYECSILGLLKYSRISPSCYMALRMLTKSDPKEVSGWYDLALSTEENPNRVESSPTSPPLPATNKRSKQRNRSHPSKLNSSTSIANNGSYPATVKNNQVYQTDHESILHLCTHPPLTCPEDYVVQVVAALYLLQALKTTSYFSNLLLEGDKKFRNSDEELRFALILLRCLQSLPYNAHALDWEPIDSSSSSRVQYACGLFPTLSLFNHSCYPSIVRYMVNDTVVVRAIRNILPGDQVTENYGQHFMTNSKKIRQAYLLKNYCFQCNCTPCQENWPDFRTLSKGSLLSYRCEFCGSFVGKSNEALISQCPKCYKQLDILESLKLTMEKHEESVAFMNNGNVKKGLEVLLENISMLDKYLVSPVNDLHVYQEHARTFFGRFGNKLSQLPAWDPLNLLHQNSDNKDE